MLRFDFYRPVNSASITAIGDDSPSSKAYGRLDAYSSTGELIDTDVSSLLVDSARETISVSSAQDDIAYVFAYADQTLEGGGPFGRFDRLVYSQLEPAATTDANGYYEIRHLFPDSYQVSVLGTRSTSQPSSIEVEKYENFVRNFSSDPNQSPSVAEARLTVAENAPAGTVVGSVTASDPDDESLTYRFAESGDHGLVIDETTGVISVGADAVVDFEAQAQWLLTVIVSDPSGASDQATITVDVADVNEAPSLQSQSYTLAETAQVGSVVGSVGASDPDQNQTLHYEIIGGDGAEILEIDPETGIISLVGALDHETLPEVTVEIRVSDDGDPPLSIISTVTLTVDDVNERPIFQHDLSPPDATSGEAFVFDLPDDLVVDPEDDAWTIVASLANGALPAWLRFDDDAMSFHGVPTSLSVGSLEVTLRVFEEEKPAAFSVLSFGFAVNLSETPLHNVQWPHDVTGDEQVAALDALRIINFLNQQGGDFSVDQTARFDSFYDVSGDNLVTALDALRVINELARLALNSSAGELVAAPEPAVAPLERDLVPLDRDLVPLDRDDQRRVWDMGLDDYLAETRLF